MGYLDDLDNPILNEQGLFEFLHFDVGAESVTRRSIKYAVMRREIAPYRIGGKNWFTKRDALDWLKSRQLQAAN